MIATVSSIGSRSLSVCALGDVALRGERLVLHAAAVDLRLVLLEHGPVGRDERGTRSGVYQTASMSIRASVPMMCAVLGPAEWDAEIVVDTAPDACVKIVATSLSAPVGPSVALAAMVVGRTEDVPRERDRVDAEVEQRAAAELERVQPVRRDRSVMRCVWSARTARTSPSAPSASSSRMRTMCGR